MTTLSFINSISFAGSNIEKALLSGSDDLLLEALKSVDPHAGDFNILVITHEIASIMQYTENNRIRNAAALALADLIGSDSKSFILDVLQKREILQSGGTLVFALNEIKATLPLMTIVGFIEIGSFEVRNEALVFLEEGRVEYPSSFMFSNIIMHLNNLTKSKDGDLAGFSRAALEYLIPHENNSIRK